MTLYITRFAQFPYTLKIFSLFCTVLLTIALTASPQVLGETTIIWITSIFSLVVDVGLILLLLMELEEVLFPLWRITYVAMETGLSLMLAIFYFISMWLAIGGGALNSNGWFTTAAFLCIGNTVLYTINFICYMRRWMKEEREARTQAYDYTNYGSPY